MNGSSMLSNPCRSPKPSVSQLNPDSVCEAVVVYVDQSQELLMVYKLAAGEAAAAASRWSSGWCSTRVDEPLNSLTARHRESLSLDSMVQYEPRETGW